MQLMILNTQISTLPNGLRVASSVMPGLQSAAMGVWVGVGGRHEGRTTTGISHFIEHMLFKGTARRSALEITRAIEGRGGYFNAFTQEESTCYYARTASRHLQHVLEIMADMYLRPRFAAEDVAREKDVIMEELQMVNDQPEQLVQEMLNAMLWRNHELGRPLTGTPETLQRINRERLLAFKNKKYVPENTLFVFAGPMDHTECVEHTLALTRRLRHKPEPRYRLVTRSVEQERLQLRAREIEQTHLALGFRLFGRFDKRRYALRLLNVVLGENMSSHLFQSVREKHGLAYAVNSSVQLFADTGVLAISAGVDTGRAVRALDLIIRELSALKKNAVSARELEEAREYAIGSMLLALENPAGHMFWMGESILNYGRIVPPEEIIAGLNEVTAEDLHHLADEFFRPERASLAVLTGAKSAISVPRMETLLGAL